MTFARAHLLAAILVLGAAEAGAAAQAEGDPELRGEVVSAVTGEPIAGAFLGLLGWERGTYSRRDGHFRLPEVLALPQRYQVEALGYVSRELTLDASAGEHVIELDPDTALLRGVETVLAHLEDRRNGARSFDREALAFSGSFSVGDFLAGRGVRRVRKFCLDERWAPGLSAAPPGDFYLVEVHGGTVRAYTEEFIEETARESRESIQRIIRLYNPVC